MDNKNLIIIAVIIVLVLAGAAAFYRSTTTSNSDTNTTDTTPTPTSTQSPTATATPTADTEIKTFNIEAGSFYFKPNEIKVKKGDKVKIVLTNKEGMQHDLVLEEFDVKTRAISGGTSDTVEFTVDNAGTFEFYCSIGFHRSNGQVGKLIVEE